MVGTVKLFLFLRNKPQIHRELSSSLLIGRLHTKTMNIKLATFNFLTEI